jgi:hypothetical protein
MEATHKIGNISITEYTAAMVDPAACFRDLELDYETIVHAKRPADATDALLHRARDLQSSTANTLINTVLKQASADAFTSPNTVSVPLDGDWVSTRQTARTTVTRYNYDDSAAMTPIPVLESWGGSNLTCTVSSERRQQPCILLWFVNRFVSSGFLICM